MKYRKLKMCLSLFLLLCCFFTINMSTIYAANIKMDENDITGGIPEEALPTFDIKLPPANNSQSISTTDESKEENIFVKGVRTLVVALGDLIFHFLKPVGADVDTIIYNKSPTGVESKFTVDFSENSSSPFSYMGRQLYIIFKSFALFIMFIILMVLGSRLQFSFTSKNKLDWKEAINSYLVSFVMIFWLPYILNYALNILNVFVSAVNPANITGLGGFTSQVEAGLTFGDAAVYLGAAILSLYFTIVYIGRALHITMFYFMFPLMSTYMNSTKFKDTFNTYISDLISTISIQLFDAVLFLGLTILFSPFGAFRVIEDAGFWKIVIAACVIPCRTLARRLLGFSKGSFGMDMLGFAGVMGAMSLARGFAGGAKNLATGVAGGISTYSNIGKLNKNSFTPESNSDIGTDAGSAAGMYSSTAVPGVNAARYSTTPDISPYMKQSYGYKDLGGGISRPITDRDEAVRGLLLHGSKQLFGSVGQAVGGVTGASVGAIAGIPFGVGGMITGANIGGALGGVAGEMSGNAVGYGVGSLPYGSNRNTTLNQEVNDSTTEQANVSSQTDLAPIINSSSVIPINNVTNTSAASDYIGLPNSTSVDGEMSQNAQDLFAHYVNNIPKERMADIESNAIKTAESYAEPLSKQYGTDKLGELYNNIKTSAMQQGAIEYAIEQIKTNHSVDVSSFESLNSEIKLQMIGNIKDQVNNFFNEQGQVNINDI